jgi:hypothetical protein
MDSNPDLHSRLTYCRVRILTRKSNKFDQFISLVKPKLAQDVGNVSPKTEGTKIKAARCLFFLMSFPFLYILNSLKSSRTIYILPSLLPVKETAEIETGMAEKSSWAQTNIRQKLGLIWRNRKKISQIIKDYFNLPFFLLIILRLGSFLPLMMPGT